jgi:hypothetical protein
MNCPIVSYELTKAMEFSSKQVDFSYKWIAKLFYDYSACLCYMCTYEHLRIALGNLVSKSNTFTPSC